MIVRTSLRGRGLLRDPWQNKGTAFTQTERHSLGLEGLLPPAVETIDEQMARVRAEYATKHTDLARHIFLRQLQDENRTLFYRFLVDDMVELLPVIYTPTVGLACQQFSRIYRRPQGLSVSLPDIDHLDEMLDNMELKELSIVVATDGERILGLGDQGIGGMGIPIGKLALYTACAGIDPATTLPVTLDVGTNNAALLADPLYLGWRHERVGGADYFDFVQRFVEALALRFPTAVLQWEDFARHHAFTLLRTYRDRICSFNDDIQGTACVALAALLGAVRMAGTRLIDQRIVIVGAGSAGCGIGEQLVRAMIDTGGLGKGEARTRIYLVGREGLLHDGMSDLLDFQKPLARPRAEVREWGEPADLITTIRSARATTLIGTSGVGGLFTEEVIRSLQGATPRPVVLPLSNPTSSAEATPEDIARWTGGAALVATGSPWHGVPQANNVYVFPGIGLGAWASAARAITDGMLTAAAHALADAAPREALLPPLTDIRAVSRKIAIAVARQAVAEGVSDADPQGVAGAVDALMWNPEYKPMEPA